MELCRSEATVSLSARRGPSTIPRTRAHPHRRSNVPHRSNRTCPQTAWGCCSFRMFRGRRWKCFRGPAHGGSHPCPSRVLGSGCRTNRRMRLRRRRSGRTMDRKPHAPRCRAWDPRGPNRAKGQASSRGERPLEPSDQDRVPPLGRSRHLGGGASERKSLPAMGTPFLCWS